MHPLNNRAFGAGAGKIGIKFYNGTAVVKGHVIKQNGTNTFTVTDGTTTSVCTLAQTTSQLTALTAGTGSDAALRASLCTIEVTPFGGSVENVMKILANAVNTVQGNTYSYVLGEAATATGEATITDANHAPVAAAAIPAQTGTVAAAWTYQVPIGSFTDADSDTLTYTATISDGSALPGWLVFTPATRTFTKAAAAGTAGAITIKVVAADSESSANETFTLTLS